MNITHSNALGGDRWDASRQVQQDYHRTRVINLGSNRGIHTKPARSWLSMEFYHASYPDTHGATTHRFPFLAKFSNTLEWPASGG